MHHYCVYWSYKSDDGRYNPYPPDHSAFIEESFAASKPKHIINKTDYAVDFNSMTQKNTITGRKRSIKRISITLHSTPSIMGYWEWEESPGKFIPYTIQASVDIEVAYMGGHPSIDLSTTTARIPYTIDITNLCQIRHSYKTRRAIRHVPLSHPLHEYLRDQVSSSRSVSKIGTAKTSSTSAKVSSRSRKSHPTTTTGTVPSSSTTSVTGACTMCSSKSTGLPPCYSCSSNFGLSTSSHVTSSSYGASGHVTPAPIGTSSHTGLSTFSSGSHVTSTSRGTTSHVTPVPNGTSSHTGLTTFGTSSHVTSTYSGVSSHVTLTPSGTSSHVTSAPFGTSSHVTSIPFGTSSHVTSTSSFTNPASVLIGSSSSTGPKTRSKGTKGKKSPPRTVKAATKTVKKPKKTQYTEVIDSKDDILKKYVKSVTLNFGQNEPCPICMSDLNELSGFEEDVGLPTTASAVSSPEVCKLRRCGHMLHKACLIMYMKNKSDGLICPTCKKIHGVKTGDMPNGTMTHCIRSYSLPGHNGYDTIEITYSFRSGTQNGNRFNATGFPRICYVPNSPKGQKVFKLLQVAWKRRLTFTIGTSVTTGATDTIVWNEIHHKTEAHGNSTGHGYPDDNYLDNALTELAAQGVEEDQCDDDDIISDSDDDL